MAVTHSCPSQTPHNGGSIKGNINTGFDADDTLNYASSCSSKTLRFLSEENYLGEFDTEDKKAKARLNLGVLSSKEVQNKISLSLADYATKSDVDKAIMGTLNLANYYTKSEVDDKLTKLNLSLDKTPTKGSNNGVTSNGVWQHVDDTVGEIHRYVKTI